ncbi:LLM class flavin-dependent oxidoreductase [Mycolicibacterium goodii]|uniref:LLM class flavin-dependent oxidoreductase n=1 Tax=Mycolicibacterium goodii TaxID=134601 RepID=UPI001BDC55EB|nr:LLM class flavin-dependent oxidoreductase [Mycolicibacterium goodii]MBU8820840.1 LLM class flavin-dependent oxidoreductase [Mycolicibacterium goodii]MBU8834501.1 LLM class flavin-dependent oxidoreductase [Mycolicibacterium goodii]
MAKRIGLNAFNMTAAGHQSSGMWRHPQSRANCYKDLDYWLDMARTLERGRFDAIFLADVLGPYDVFEGSPAPALRNGMQIPANDPFQYVSAMASVTSRLGFAVTASATFEHPYPLARRLSTLDHLTKGRVGWNVVTSYLPSASRNFGVAPLAHDDRYELAEEFMSVVYKLWESWDDDAVKLDRDGGVFVDPDKVHPIHHEGRFFKVDGFNMAEPSPQKTPVIFQAGASSRGRKFAAEHGEGLFVNVLNSKLSRVITDDIRTQTEAAGRKRDDVKIYTILSAVIADSDAEAERKYKEYKEYASPDGAMALFGGFSGINLANFDKNAPLEAADTNAIQTVLDLFTKLDPSRKWTPADIANHMSIGGIEPVLVGSPETVADEIERWIDEGDLDGINLSYAVTPHDIEMFVDTVVPELQKRGRVWKEYEGETLREYLAGKGNRRLSPTHPGSRAVVAN